MEDEFNGGRRRSIKGQGQERAAVCLVARMICRENAKEKQQGEEEMPRHQVLHGSCLITHTRGSMHIVFGLKLINNNFIINGVTKFNVVSGEKKLERSAACRVGIDKIQY